MIIPTPAQAAQMATAAQHEALTARGAALHAALPAVHQARAQGTRRGTHLHWTATTADVAALLANETCHEGLWPGHPTWAPVARRSLADVRIPWGLGRPVQTTPDPDLPDSAYDWFDLDQAPAGAVIRRTSSDRHTITARRGQRTWSTDTDSWVYGPWQVVEQLRWDDPLMDLGLDEA